MSSRLIEITAYRSEINVSPASVLTKRRVAVITVILIIALHNYRAHRSAICTRLDARLPLASGVPLSPSEPNGREKVNRTNAINSQAFERGGEAKGEARGGGRILLSSVVIDAMKFFDDLAPEIQIFRDHFFILSSIIHFADITTRSDGMRAFLPAAL